MGRLFDAVARAVRDPCRGQLRGPGGDRARGGLRPARARQLPDRASVRREMLVIDPRDDDPRGRRRRRRGAPLSAPWRSALSCRDRARDGRRLRAHAAERTAPTWSCSRAACSRTGGCSRRHGRGPRRCRAARARPGAAAGRRRRHLLRSGGRRRTAAGTLRRGPSAIARADPQPDRVHPRRQPAVRRADARGRARARRRAPCRDRVGT